MHTLMCIVVLTSGICSYESCTIYDMNIRPSRGNASIEDDSPGSNEEHVRRRVLSVAQYLVYCVSGGKNGLQNMLVLISTKLKWQHGNGAKQMMLHLNISSRL